MKRIVFLITFLIFNSFVFSQVGVGTKTPEVSSVLDVVSSNKGFLPPRLASDADVTDPAEGLVIYDESDDCLNVFDGNSWVNLCDAPNGAGGAGDGSGINQAVAGQSDYSWGTPLRFTQLMMPLEGDSSSMVTATSTDGNAYVWGRDVRNFVRSWKSSTDATATIDTRSLTGNGTDQYLISPNRLNDPAFNGKVKAFYNVDDLYAIHTTDGEVYTFGHKAYDMQNSSAGSYSSYFNQTRAIEMPTGYTFGDADDFKLSRLTYFMLTPDGKVHWRGSTIGGASTTTNWKTFAAPTGESYTSGFKYTEILNKFKSPNGRIFLRGSDNKIYFVGTGTAAERVGGPNYNSSSSDPTSSSGIFEIPFPTGVAEKIVRLKSSDDNAVAITSDGEAYVWGTYKKVNGGSTPDSFAFKIDPSVTVPPLSTFGSGLSYTKLPAKVALPAEETTILDMDFSTAQNMDEPTVIVGGSGKVYFFGGRAGTSGIFGGNTTPYNEYTPAWSAERVVAKSAYIVGEIYAYLDAAGQYFHHGPIVNSGGGSTLYGTTAVESSVAIPITDGTKDSTNPNSQ